MKRINRLQNPASEMAKVTAKQTDIGLMRSGQTASKSQIKGTKVKRLACPVFRFSLQNRNPRTKSIITV